MSNTRRSVLLAGGLLTSAAVGGILKRECGVSGQADEEVYTSMTNCDVSSNSSFRPRGGCVMKYSKRSFAVISMLFGVLLSLSAGTLNARDADLALAAAQTVKQQCINTCRARYRDCRHLNQLPSFECRGVYRDCTRYTCTGLGPG
jgi:hypothetical protein